MGIALLGFTAFGVGAAEIMTSVQIAMGAGLPYTALRDTILTDPTLVEGLIPLFSSAPSVGNSEPKTVALRHSNIRDQIRRLRPSEATISHIVTSFDACAVGIETAQIAETRLEDRRLNFDAIA